MIHLAIFKKEWGMVEKILAGKKSVESRWFRTKKAPWGRVKKGERVYLKNSGDDVCGVAEVKRVVQHEDLSRKTVQELLRKYYRRLGIGESDLEKFYDYYKNKRYCVLIFLKNPERINSFAINKSGFGLMSSRICFDDVNQILP
jgi:ASC-1-like (ASCH) protein